VTWVDIKDLANVVELIRDPSSTAIVLFVKLYSSTSSTVLSIVIYVSIIAVLTSSLHLDYKLIYKLIDQLKLIKLFIK